MSSQNEGPFLDVSSTETRPAPGPFTAASHSEAWSPTEESQESRGRKRKRGESSLNELLKDAFSVQPYPRTKPSKPNLLYPYILLSRALLPLSSLDLAPSSSVLPRSRLYEGHVKILELEERMGSQPTILIARHGNGRTFFAVEREDRGLYAVCQLGAWVDLGQLKTIAVAATQRETQAHENGVPRPQFKAAIETPATRKEVYRKRLAIEALQSMVKRPVASLLTESQLSAIQTIESQEQSPNPLPEQSRISETEIPHVEGQNELRLTNGSSAKDVTQQLSANEHFENVRSHYFEALYISEASLAYFAKGPLSRARAAFHFDLESILDMKDLVAFLESTILSSSQLDRKFRDGLIECIANIDTQDHSASEAQESSNRPKKRKSAKKWKLGKTGLYSTELEYVRTWWLSKVNNVQVGDPGSSRTELMKMCVAELRNRETQLQMIVILEVLALRSMLPAQYESEQSLPLTAAEPLKVVPKLAKSKKPDLLEKLIDMHIDRLCIWQSTESMMGATTHHAQQDSRDHFHTTTHIEKQASTSLRDFCVDVIVPFFYARLRDRCEIINRRLGGPIVKTPTKPRAPGTNVASQTRPGAATRRALPAKQACPLKRHLTDERERERRSMSRGPSRPITLSRSATAPLALSVKSEGVETQSLLAIPSIDNQRSRGGLLNSKRFARREMDLGKIASEVNIKAQKQAMIEAELKQAITTLKKPNRDLVGKEIVENAEQRSAARMRKSKKPARNPLYQHTQIAATPKICRQYSAMKGSQLLDLPRVVEDLGEPSIPLLSLPRIPQSVDQHSRSCASITNPLCQTVQATPSRKPASSEHTCRGNLGLPATDYDGLPPSSPINICQSTARLFTLIPDSAIKATSDNTTDTPYLDTPIKKRPEILDKKDPCIISSGKENDYKTAARQGGVLQAVIPDHENTIYQMWDDVDGMIDEIA